jgi:hypothetical protein
MIATIIGTTRETFRIRKENPGTLDLNGIVAILVVGTFCLVCVLETMGYGTVPTSLQNIMGIFSGWFFRGGYDKHLKKNGNRKEGRGYTLEGGKTSLRSC